MNATLLHDLHATIAGNANLELIAFQYSDFIFEERVKLNCFYCKRYNTTWTCPPKIPTLNYKQIFSEYDNFYILKYEKQFTPDEFADVRKESTNTVHRALLEFERCLYMNNESLAVSFIGGSCKLCKNGCNPERCNSPDLARIPWEATGVNVVASLKNIQLQVQFPLTDRFYRYGLIMW